MNLARCFLLLAWFLPSLSVLWSSLALQELFFDLPPGVGILESDRTLLLFLSLLAYLLSTGIKTTPLGPAKGLAQMFLAWAVISSLLGGAPFDSLLFSQMWFAAVLFFAACRRLMDGTGQNAVRVYLLHSPVVLLVTVALIPLFFESESRRIGGVFELAGVFANWLIILLPLLLLDALREKGGLAVLALASSTLSLVAIAFTFSRAGWLLATIELSLVMLALSESGNKRFLKSTVALFAGLAFLILARAHLTPGIWGLGYVLLLSLPVVIEGSSKRISPKLIARLLGIILIACSLGFGISQMRPDGALYPRAADRMELLRTTDNSSVARISFWKSAGAMTLAHPISGVGPGNFSTHYPQYQETYLYYSNSPHSAILELSSETGITGSLLFLAAWGAFLLKVFSVQLSLMQRCSLIGLLCGMAYAQIDVSYQFGYVWLTLSLVAALLLPPKEQIEQDGPNPIRSWNIVVALLALLVSLYLLPVLRSFELAKQGNKDAQALAAMHLASSKLPWWKEASIATFQAQLTADPKAPQLREQLPQLLRQAPDSAIAYGLAGEYLNLSGQPLEALAQFELAINLDPFNYPDFYRSIYQIAALLSDQDLLKETQETVLSIYRIENIDRAHTAHRAKLQAQLNPLLYDIADHLNPYFQPLETESIYRYLYELDGSPRSAHGLGISLWTQGKEAEARKYLLKAHELSPVYPPPP